MKCLVNDTYLQAQRAEPEVELIRTVARKRLRVCIGVRDSNSRLEKILKLKQEKFYSLISAPRGQAWFNPKNLEESLRRAGELQNSFLSFADFTAYEALDRESESEECISEEYISEEGASEEFSESEWCEESTSLLPVLVTGFSQATVELEPEIESEVVDLSKEE